MKPYKPKRAFTGQTRLGCVYCSGEHKAVDCTEIVDAQARRNSYWIIVVALTVRLDFIRRASAAIRALV